jgi:radical SAM superfamily enzyme YgiQ (UPF0313 family)
MSAVSDRHQMELVDLCFSEDPVAELKLKIPRLAPDVVAVGLRNLQNNEYSAQGVNSNQSYYESIFNTIRACTSAPVVVGGGGFSVAPERLMRLLNPDFGIIGEGEVSFPALLDCLGRGETDPSTVPGLWRFKGGNLECTLPSAQSVDINRTPQPDRGRVDTRYYDSGIESIQTKRGCSLSCDYCTYPLIEGRSYRLKDPSVVVDEMIGCLNKNSKINHFFIVDSVFNIPASHAKLICKEMIRRNMKTPWTCYANPLAFDEELADLMKGAGCAGMEVGSDSGSDIILKKLRKGFTTQRIEALHRISKDRGLKDCHTFILGTPGETVHDVRETIKFIEKLDPYAAVFMIWSDDGALVTSKKNEVYLRNEILSELRVAAGHHSSWVVPELGIHFDRNVFQRLRARGFHGPLWQYIRLSDN